MVGHALVVRQQVIEHEAVLDRALAALQALDVRRLGGGDQAVDDLLQRLHLPGGGHILLPEGVQRPHEDIVDRGGQHAQLPLRLVAEGQPLLP